MRDRDQAFVVIPDFASLHSGLRLPTSAAVLANIDIDVEVDLRDTALLGLVRSAFMPTPVTGTAVADRLELEAAPLRQFARTLAAELPGQHDLLAILVGADDMRT